MAISIAYSISGDTFHETVRRDLKFCQLRKFRNMQRDFNWIS